MCQVCGTLDGTLWLDKKISAISEETNKVNFTPHFSFYALKFYSLWFLKGDKSVWFILRLSSNFLSCLCFYRLIVYVLKLVLNFHLIVTNIHLTIPLFCRQATAPPSPHRCPSPVPPVRLWFPGSSHGCDEDEVPLSEKGEVSPRTVAPLIECHSGRGNDLQLGMRPKDGTSQEGRGTWIFYAYLY